MEVGVGVLLEVGVAVGVGVEVGVEATEGELPHGTFVSKAEQFKSLVREHFKITPPTHSVSPTLLFLHNEAEEGPEQEELEMFGLLLVAELPEPSVFTQIIQPFASFPAPFSSSLHGLQLEAAGLLSGALGETDFLVANSFETKIDDTASVMSVKIVAIKAPIDIHCIEQH